MPGDASVISRLLFERAPWDAVDAAFEKRIPFDSPHEHANVLERMVAAGEAVAHHILRDGRRIGLLVTRVDQGSLGRELVVVAVFCASRAPVADHLVEAWEAMARAENCVSVRFHTCRVGATRLAVEKFGYRVTEIVMRKTLS